MREKLRREMEIFIKKEESVTVGLLKKKDFQNLKNKNGCDRMNRLCAKPECHHPPDDEHAALRRHPSVKASLHCVKTVEASEILWPGVKACTGRIRRQI